MDPRTLIERMAALETALLDTRVLAPCVPGGGVRVRLDGLVYTFRPEDPTFEGWGVFQPVDAKVAGLVAAARPAQIGAYLGRLPAASVILVERLIGQTWLAIPADVTYHRAVAPVRVLLAKRGQPFARCRVRRDGTVAWYEAPDRRTDPQLARTLCRLLDAETPPERLRVRGLTPAHRWAYGRAWHQTAAFRRNRRRKRATERLSRALAQADGTLHGYRDLDNRTWRVDWSTATGERHTSVVRKRDLTVVSAGICLDGGDTAFDLTSLIAVVEDAPEWA